MSDGASSPTNPTCDDPKQEVARTTRATLRSVKHASIVFACAAACRIVFGLLKVLVKRRFAVSAFADEVVSLNPIKWGAYFGAWALHPGLTAVLRLLASRVAGLRDETTRGVAALVAGALCAQSGRVFEMATRTELALYLFVRAVHGRLVAHVLPRLPERVQKFEHYDLITMGLTGSQILYAIIFSPLSHSANYMGFLQSCTMLSRQTCDAVAAYHRSHMTPALVNAFGIANAPADTTDMSQICRFVHLNPADGCDVNLVKWMWLHLRKVSLPLYVPLKVSTTIIFNSKGIVKRPLATLWNVIQSSFTSAVFLTLYCAGPERSLCFTAQHGIRGGYKLAIFGGVSCAAATLLEPKSRRLDLALYCCIHALRSAVMTLYHRGYISRPRGSWIAALHTVAVAVLLHQFEAMPETLNPKLRSGLQYIVQHTR